VRRRRIARQRAAVALTLDALREGHRLAARHLDPQGWTEDGRPGTLAVLCEVDDVLESALLGVQCLAVEAEAEALSVGGREILACVRLAAIVAAPWAALAGLGALAGWWL
jgi:hypothetical protein